MATFRTANYNIRDGSVNRTIFVRWYEISSRDLDIRRLTRTNGQLDRPGVNASFFNPGNSRMTSIHWFNRNAVHTGGDTNLADAGNTDTSMSCMFFPINPATVLFKNRATGINNLGIDRSNIQWAIGGFSLLLNETHSGLDSMIRRYEDFYSGMNVGTWMPGLRVRRARTFIGDDGRGNLRFGVMSTNITSASPGTIADDFNDTSLATGLGATYFDMYSVLRDRLNCTRGLALDGGGSTRIRRISPLNTSSAIQYSAQRDQNRNVLCQLSFSGAQSN